MICVGHSGLKLNIHVNSRMTWFPDPPAPFFQGRGYMCQSPGLLRGLFVVAYVFYRIYLLSVFVLPKCVPSAFGGWKRVSVRSPETPMWVLGMEPCPFSVRTPSALNRSCSPYVEGSFLSLFVCFLILWDQQPHLYKISTRLKRQHTYS